MRWFALVKEYLENPATRAPLLVERDTGKALEPESYFEATIIETPRSLTASLKAGADIQMNLESVG
jgi:hypothetical protein